jgi:Coenzyme PQQ synthesis protein D (PqqD)
MDADSRPTRRADVLAQAAGDTVILLTPDSGEYFTLNEVGGRIWELADGSRSVAEIAAALGEEYEAPLEEIQADALDVLSELAGQRLITDGAVGA